MNVVSNELPKAYIVRHTQSQVVVMCPYCGKEHFHGNIDGGLGSHVAHCIMCKDGMAQSYDVISPYC